MKLIHLYLLLTYRLLYYIINIYISKTKITNIYISYSNIYLHIFGGNMNKYLALQKIVELKSFSRAAESLGYTQSAISQMISSLENELSIKLLKRSRNGVTLTPEGVE